MANSVTHSFVSGKADDADTSLVRPSDWNAEHTVTIDPSTVDHGGLAGLSDDDHTQYALLAGRSGGQTLVGSTDAGTSLTIKPNSSETTDYVHINAGGSSTFSGFFNSEDKLGLLISRTDAGNSYIGLSLVGRTTMDVGGLGLSYITFGPNTNIDECVLCYDYQYDRLGIHFDNSVPTFSFDNSGNFGYGVATVSYKLHIGRPASGNFDTIALAAASWGLWDLKLQWTANGSSPGDTVGILKFLNVDSGVQDLEVWKIQGLHSYIGGSPTASELRFLEPTGSGSNYTGFKAQSQSASITYTLPAEDGVANAVLSTDGAGVLSWVPELAIDNLSDGDATTQIWEEVLVGPGLTVTELASGSAMQIDTVGFSGTVSPVTSITVVNGIVTAVS